MASDQALGGATETKNLLENTIRNPSATLPTNLIETDNEDSDEGKITSSLSRHKLWLIFY